jgi:D-lyxose ketol-isomerase
MRGIVSMKRSEINQAIAEASLAFSRHHWHLPPNPRWDVTGFGLGDFKNYGLVLVNLAEMPEYCEKIMYARCNQKTPNHTHGNKQEDIICRVGTLAIQLFAADEKGNCLKEGTVKVLRNGEEISMESGTILYLREGERVTLRPGAFHEFWPVGDYAIIGEVSTYNDDAADNFFVNKEVGRFEQLEEDVPAMFPLVSD